MTDEKKNKASNTIELAPERQEQNAGVSGNMQQPEVTATKGVTPAAAASNTVTTTQPTVQQSTLDAEKQAQASHAQAKSVTDEASEVSVKYGTPSAGVVEGVVATAQDDANAKGALADEQWDKELLRNGPVYQQMASTRDFAFAGKGAFVSQLSQFESAIQNGVQLTESGKQKYQFLRDVVDGEIHFAKPALTAQEAPNEPVSATQVAASQPTAVKPTQQSNVEEWNDKADYKVGDRVKYGDTMQELVTKSDGCGTEWKVVDDEAKKETDSERASTTPKPVGYKERSKEKGDEDETPTITPSYVDADGRNPYEVVAQDGIVKTKDKNGKEHLEFRQVSFTPRDSTESYKNGLAKLEKDYESALDKARKDKDANLQKVLDSTATMGDKADAIEKMAAADEVIKRYTDPEYVRGMRARKVLGTISDALAAMGNILTASKGGTAMKLTSASAQVEAKEKANEAALQKRIDYWTNKMNSARNSDLKASNLLQSRGITSVLKSFESAERLERNKFTAKSAALKSTYDLQKDIDKRSQAYIEKWNENVWKWLNQKDKQAYDWLKTQYMERQRNARNDKNNAVRESEGSKNRANSREIAEIKANAGSII